MAGIFFSHNIKQIIKIASVYAYDKVVFWDYFLEPQPFKAFNEEKLLIDKQFVAFTNKLVFSEGERVLLNLIGNTNVDVKIFQINRKGERATVSNFTHSVRTPTLAVFSSYDGIISPSEVIEIDAAKFGSGWFSVHVTNSKKESLEIPIFIDPKKIEKKVLFVESTDTLLAYNPSYNIFKIPNYYKKNLGKSQTSVIPQNTPIFYNQLDKSQFDQISCMDHLINSDLVHKINLDSLGVDFQSISDELLDKQKILNNVDLLIFGSHNEYWTEEKAKNVINFINRGGKVLLLGGNSAWRQVYRLQGRTWMYGRGTTINPVFLDLVTQYFGTYYKPLHLVNSGTLKKVDPPDDYDTHASIKVLDHKAFLKYFSVNIEPNTFLGVGSRFAHCNEKILGISGHETDKLTEQSKGFVHLAKGLNKLGGADIVYKKFISEGEVLNFSSVSTWHNKDPIIFSLIDRFIYGGT